MYPTSGATIRGDIMAKLEEAVALDKFFIGQQVMPAIGVDVKSATYPKLDIAGAALATSGDTVRTRGGSYGEISRKWGSDTYDCIDRGLEEAVDDTDVRDLRRFFNLEVATAKLVLRNVRTAHEQRVAAAVMNTTNFGAATNSAVAYTSANRATLSFVDDVLQAIERITDNGAEANTIVLSSAVYQRIRQGTLVKEFVAGSLEKGALVNATSLAAAFADHGIRQVLVGRARVNTANKGAAKSMSSVWGNSYVWVGAVNLGASRIEDALSGGAGFTLVWNAEGGIFVSETYRDEKRRSNMVRVRQNTAEKIVDPTCGTLIGTQYS